MRSRSWLDGQMWGMRSAVSEDVHSKKDVHMADFYLCG